MRADLTYCDFLIFAPLELEITALKNALKKSGWNVEYLEDDNYRFPSIYEVKLSDSTVSYLHRTALIIQLHSQGVLNACVDAARALEFYEPGYVISFGIAGSFNSEDAPIKGVCLADALFYYEPSKDDSSGTKSRMLPIKVDSTFNNIFRAINNIGAPTVVGPFASGEKLIADFASFDRDRILDVNDKILAVEMEAAGIGLAIKSLQASAEFVVIKGISDLANNEKNSIPQQEQKENREEAARNAAFCLAKILKLAPLRRSYRGRPDPFRDSMSYKARRETKQIASVCKEYGIRTEFESIYTCLYGRRGPIPAYFHWRQKHHALHWIDFKILSAIKALPKDVVIPIPLVTIASDSVTTGQSWYQAVEKLLGVSPVTDEQIKDQYEQISQYGFENGAARAVREKLEELRQTGEPNTTLNIMYYMLGQFCHRRMFVFTWKEYREKWKQLNLSFDTWFSILDWETMTLGGAGGKQQAPGLDLLIEPNGDTLIKWLSNKPSAEIVAEFVQHFIPHVGRISHSANQDGEDVLIALIEYWKTNLFNDDFE